MSGVRQILPPGSFDYGLVVKTLRKRVDPMSRRMLRRLCFGGVLMRERFTEPGTFVSPATTSDALIVREGPEQAPTAISVVWVAPE